MGGEHRFSSQAWLHGGILAVSTLNGEVLITLDGDQKAILHPGVALHCIRPWGKGFVVGTDDSTVVCFRAVDERTRCVITQSLRLSLRSQVVPTVCSSACPASNVKPSQAQHRPAKSAEFSDLSESFAAVQAYIGLLAAVSLLSGIVSGTAHEASLAHNIFDFHACKPQQNHAIYRCCPTVVTRPSD